MTVPLAGDSNCVSWIVQYPNGDTTQCPVLEKQIKYCGKPICSECEIKVDIAMDPCCGEMYQCGEDFK